MSITKMTNETAKAAQPTTTTTSAANTKSETKLEVAHWLNQRDETTFSKYDFVGWILFYIFYLIVHVGVLVG